MSLLGLPSQNTTEWVTYRAEVYFLRVLEARSPRSQFSRCGFCGGLFPRLADPGHLLAVWSHGSFSGAHVLVLLLLLIRAPVILD